ncbi:MAG: hypothetical protein GY793_06605 [Proteobacteria bacterium]|nr:hypothetical protein [Pseudomonadota bacterium]
MKTKIKSLTIINSNRIIYYEVGRTYNNLVLDRIIDNTVDIVDIAYVSQFRGQTIDRGSVFEAINCPVEIEYCKEEED